LKLTLGIDAGGTYTDAVLIDPDSGQVRAKAKALTWPRDLSIGIAASLDGLDVQDGSTEGSTELCRSLADVYEHVKLVSVSTTLATNAIIEGHGGRVALLLIGYDEEMMERSGLAKRLPVEGMCYVAGGHDVKGDEVCPLDIEAARQAILGFRDRVAQKLNTRCIIPPHAEAGNAVEAIVASVTHTVEILVQPFVMGAGTVTYLIHSPRGREQAGASFARAVRRAEAIAVEMARKAVYRAWAKKVSVTVDHKRVELGKLSEMTVRARAAGRPRLADE